MRHLSHPHLLAPQSTSPPESTPPLWFPLLRMDPHIMDVVCLTLLCHQRCSPSSSPPNLPSWKRNRGTTELVEDDDEEDEEIEEILDSR
ncbi:hypothetical protein Tco_1007953 [Tanacetum coccineum]